MSSIKVLNVELEVREETEKGTTLNVNIANDFNDLLGKDLTIEFSTDPSLQNITDALSLLIEKYINLKCEKEKPE